MITIIFNTNNNQQIIIVGRQTDSAQSSSNKCKNELLKIYAQHINLLITI